MSILLRYSVIHSVLLGLFVACGTGPGEERKEATTPVLKTDVASTGLDELPGYYEDTLPCADCPGILTQLWVRSDSTFVLREEYMEHDTLPSGLIGQWHVMNGLVTIGRSGDKPMFYRPTTEGLMLVDEMGTASPSGLDMTLDRLSDEIQDEIPRMRLTGTFTYLADAMSFKPCGTRYTWPCAGGEALGAEEDELIGSMTSAVLERMYLGAVKKGGDPWTIVAECSMSMGPAMEGDGADEYILIHRVLDGKAECME